MFRKEEAFQADVKPQPHKNLATKSKLSTATSEKAPLSMMKLLLGEVASELYGCEPSSARLLQQIKAKH